MIERLLAAERALADGELAQAQRLFAQVADADARNAMAVVGLAEVALARGDLDGARSLASRALAIDPDDAAAARLAETPPPVAAPEPAAPGSGAPGSAAPEPVAAATESGSAVTRLRAWFRRLLGARG